MFPIIGNVGGPVDNQHFASFMKMLIVGARPGG